MRFAAAMFFCAISATAQFGPANGSVFGPWALDRAASKMEGFPDAEKGSAIVYPNGVLFLFLDPAGDPYAFSYSLGPGNSCVPLGHMPGARCELLLEENNGKVVVRSPSGATTTTSWQLSADGQELTSQHARAAEGESVVSKLVWRKPATSEALQPIRPPQKLARPTRQRN